MKRGEIWTGSVGADYTGKPRPVIIIQSDLFAAEDSVTVCPVTSDPREAFVRIDIKLTATNGLRVPSHIMADKISSVPRRKLGRKIGALGEDDLGRLNRALIVFLGLAGSSER